jgi:hypothetical protein
MKFSSSKDKERSITGAIPEELPFRKPVSRGGGRRSLTGTLVVAEIQMVLAVEFSHRWAKDFHLGRESAHV